MGLNEDGSERRPKVTFSADTKQSYKDQDGYCPWLMEGDEEFAPRDPGVIRPPPRAFTANDFEGHRAHTMYVGVHLPGEKRHRKHKHSRANSRDSDEEDRPRQFAMGRRLSRLASITDDGETFTPPAQRVQFILGEDGDNNTHEVHPLFSEMEELFREDDCLEWRETARWIKFEEDVEEGGNRWSKPHVATLSLHSLFELRSLLLNGTVVLDMEACTLEQVADLTLDHMVNSGALHEDAREKVRDILLQRHRHLHERRKESNMRGLPIIRSLADIGRSHSSSKNMQRSGSDRSVARTSSLPTPQEPFPATTTTTGQRFLTVPGAPAGGGGGGEGMDRSPSSVSMSRNHSFSDIIGEHKGNLGFMRKIPPGAEASNILVGEVDFLEKPLSAFIRLKTSTVFGDLTEVPVPTRFMFILLGPTGGIASFHEIGRAMATLMSDEVFHEVAYRARNRTHLLAAVDEFLDAVTVLPPGEWDPSIRIEPPAAVPSQDPRKRPEKPIEYVDPEILEQKLREESGLSRTGRLFGGLVNDLKRKAPWYWSDFKDALAMQCVASWIFLYFACLSPIITFGGLLSEATGKNMAAMESLISGFVCGMGYGFFSGQPLTILGSTGPVLVFETIVYDFCGNAGWDYMSFRLWIGLWVAFILFVLVAIDASALVCYITRFTEENFATLIAFIFIYKAVENVLRIGKKFPIDSHRGDHLTHCMCEPPPLLVSVEGFNWTTLEREACVALNGSYVGEGCVNTRHVPDVFLMSILLFFGTFTISIILKDFKTALFFPTKVRQFISDFAVIIAIVSMTFIDYLSNIPTPKLEVPSEFKPTLPGRGWVVSPWKNPIWTIPLAVLPALLGTILIFMDQQITAVIVNRKENKLKKGCGYHLDLFVLCILIAVCSIMGLPWFVAATVLSINHVNSLKLESECAAPGDKPQFLGVREQRVTHILIFLMIGLSVTITPVLRHIPMPVLFGVFLYMGVASLKGLQFFDRILIMFMPAKYQPDYMFLRKVPIKRVHMFTCIQFACLVMLWLIKSFQKTSILFPLMLVVMIGIRKSLDFIFTQRELKILDDVMPETIKRTEEDEKELGPEEEKQGMDDNLQIPLANGNIMKIPLTSINISEEVPKTGIWKQVNMNKSEKKHNSIKLKKRSLSKEAATDEEKVRLAPMAEQEEDDGRVTIKVDKARNLKTLEHRNDFYSDNGSETTV
ncbi:sodium bicarbonate cotransporter 3-like isoform X2 [Macrosteles quadrilineatus]|uniref:sodium bicarbonate cotransporter 3-like isoform X2 n=1 Tax=Macrosteles quadrilineatus TaxID=74068 RepID=UPI0023E0CCB5|nr:sodium bicarbonate cotransporter 3-like isoform X2 [Macrosteles quadrilineatus]